MNLKQLQPRISRAIVLLLASGFIQTGVGAPAANATAPNKPTITSVTSDAGSITVNLATNDLDATQWRWSLTRRQVSGCANIYSDGVVQATVSLTNTIVINGTTEGCRYLIKVAGFNGLIGEYAEFDELAGGATNGLNIFVKSESGVSSGMTRTPLNKDSAGICNPAFSRVNNIDIDYGSSGPTNCPVDGFTSYYIGYIKAPFTGSVNFKVASDDGFILSIQGQNVFTYTGDAAPVNYNASGSINMVADEIYRFEAWHHEYNVGSAAKLYWDWSGQSTVIIPQSSFATDPSVFFGTCPIGLTSQCAANSAMEIKRATGTNMDGQYWIKVNGVPTLTYCIMNSAMSGGGWMLAMKGKESASTFDYGDALWTDANTLNETYPERWRNADTYRDIDAKYGVYNYAPSNQIMALFPEQSGYAGGAIAAGTTGNTSTAYGFSWIETTTAMRPWAAYNASAANGNPAGWGGNSYNVAHTGGPTATPTCVNTATTLRNLFNTASRCAFRQVSSTYSASESPYSAIGNGLFYSQTQIRFFGINYGSSNTGNRDRARFGFGWNENNPGDEGSSDGTAGIGIDRQGYSSITTGSINNCCATQNGISGASVSSLNIAFEMYVRNSLTATVSATSFRATQKRTSSLTAGTGFTASNTNGTNTFGLSPMREGFTVNPSNGKVTVAESVAPGTYAFTATVTDSDGVTGASSFTIQVVADSQETDTALNFTGSNILATSSTFPILTGNQTWEAWVRPTTGCASTQKTVIGSESFVLLCISGYWYVGFRSSAGWNTYQTSQNINYDSWTHVAVVRSGSTVTTYINEAQTRFWNGSAWADSWDIASIYDVPSSYYIGGYSNQQQFTGLIDEVKIWSEARTLSQIVTGMYAAPDLSSANLDAYWDFNEGSGTSAISRSQRSNSGYNLTPLSTQWTSVATTTTSGVYTVVSIPRTLISKTPGWRVPDSITAATVLLVGGGGGGAGSFTTQISAAAGAGGAGGVYTARNVPLEPKSYVTLKVGAGGAAGVPSDVRANARGYKGATTTFDALSAGGGGAGGYFDATNQDGSAGTAGGAGGGASNYYEAYISGDPGASSSATVNGKVFGASATAGSGAIWNGAAGHTGGGAGGAATPTTRGPGVASAITGETVTYGIGGGANGVAGWTFNQQTSFGNGGDANYNNSTGGGQGGSGLIVIRYITRLKPTFTQPTNTTINVGMTETFTLNIAQDSATVGLTRSFRWESTTAGSGGTFSTIKSGTGAANAFFSWVPPDTSTSGNNFLFRVIVTDTDGDGLFIQETSTAVFATINGRLVISGKSSISKTVNISKTETFTVTGGTSTFRYTLLPDGPNFWLDTSTAGTPRLRMLDTVTVGTYYETITVIDSVSATSVIPLTIKVSPPPSFSANAEQVDSGTVLYLDAGNTSSYSGAGTTWVDLSGRNISTSIQPTGIPAQFNSGPTFCSAPSYSGEALGSFNFSRSGKSCAYVSNFGFHPIYTAQTWVKRDGNQNDYAAIIATPWPGWGNHIAISLHWINSTNIQAGVYKNDAWGTFTSEVTVPDRTWTFVTITFDGTNISLIVNGVVSTKNTGIPNATALSSGVTSSGLFIGKRFDGDADYINGSISFIRIYNRVLSDSEILQNFNATKGRFLNTQNKQAQSGKYGTRYSDTFTVTAGSETITAAWSNSSLTRITWDTSTARSLLLSTQESLTPGVYYDTITVTDIYGSFTRIPLTYTIAKADTLTVWIETPTAVNYTGTNAVFPTVLRVSGLVSSDTGTAITSVRYRPSGSSCATGGVCSVGDIGPGGGVVFITPSTVGGNGRYFEAAPFTWAGADELGTTATYCSNGNLNLGATNIGIGWGETNTNIAKSTCLGGAVAKVNTFNASNSTGYSDWFIPSSNELVELAKVRTAAGLIALGSNWTVGRYGYWSSTEVSASVQASLVASSWSMGGTGKSDAVNNLVRPVRMFTPCSSVNNCSALATTAKPIDAGTYRMNAETLTLSIGDLSNYLAIRYETTTVTINKVAQSVQQGAIYNAQFPDAFTLFMLTGSGTGAVSYSISNGGTAANCATDYRKISATSVGTCNVQVVRLGDRNYLSDTSTSYVYFMNFVINQPAPAVGSGPNIALTGQTSVQLEATTAPTISGLSASSGAVGTTITITGAGFYFADPTKLSIKFWRNIGATTYTINSDTSVTVTVPVGATTGRIVLTTPNGQAASSTFTVTT